MNNILLGVGINDKQYPTKINAKITKQYNTWYSMLERCYCQKYQKQNQRMLAVLLVIISNLTRIFMSGVISRSVLAEMVGI